MAGESTYRDRFILCLELCEKLFEKDLDHLGLAKVLQKIGLLDADEENEVREWYTRKSLAMKH